MLKADDAMRGEARQWCLTGLLVLVGVAWGGFIWFVVRPTFIDAFYDRGPAWLNPFITAERDLESYIAYLDHMLSRSWVAVALVAGYLGWTRQQRWPVGFFERIVGRAAPETLALARILTTSILLLSTLWEDLASGAVLPAELIQPPGIIHILYLIPGFHGFVAQALPLSLLQWGTVVALIMAGVGAWSRYTVPISAGLYLVLAGLLRQYTWAYHTGLIPIYVMAVMSFTRCGDAWSVDHWLRERGGRSRPITPADRVHYGWSRFAIVLVIVVPYVEAGLSKLCMSGITWWQATNMRAILYTDSLNPMEFDWGISLKLVQAPDYVFTALGITAVLGELAMSWVLFSKHAKLLLPGLMIVMHLGILLLQNILFFDLILLCCLLYGFALLADRNGPWDLRRLFRKQARYPSGIPKLGGMPVDRLKTESKVINRLLTLFISVALMSWVFAIELYPLTGMQMYAKAKLSGEIQWYRVMAEMRSGAVGRAYPEEVIPALRDSRYRRVLRMCFNPEQQKICRTFLETTGRLLNARQQPLGPIVALEVQRHQWNFLTFPNDPNYGRIQARYRVLIGPASPEPVLDLGALRPPFHAP